MESMDLKAVKCLTAGNDTLRLLGSRGPMEILCLFCCSQRRVRFTELGNLFTHISTKTLASRLKELEKNGLLTRTAYNEIPPRVEYSMTKKGQSLIRLGRGAAAVPELERAIALKPDYWPPYVQLSDYYKESGQIALAREILEKALAQSPGVETLKQRLAELDGSRGKQQKNEK